MSNIENLSRKKLFRIKSESIVDFLKEKVSLEKCKSIEIFGGEGVNDSIFSKRFLIPVQNHTVLLSKSVEIIENYQNGVF